MSIIYNTTRVAVVQAASVMFDSEACIDKAEGLIRKAGKNEAKLILFPEAFIPGYPRGLSFGTVIGSRSSEGRDIWALYLKNSIAVPGPETNKIGAIAKESGTYVAVGVIERDSSTGGTLYCTILYFSPDGKLVGKHRKLKPTGAERIIWGEGDGSTLTVLDTDIGKIGGLICWENYMPLARMSMYNKGVEIYLAPTADARETWQSTLIHIACEGRCYVLGCNQFVTRDMYPQDLPGIDEIKQQPEILCSGGSVIISPMGEIIAGPLYDKEGILYADIDLSQIKRGKFDLDVAGHYSRNDVFDLKILNQPDPIKVKSSRKKDK